MWKDCINWVRKAVLVIAVAAEMLASTIGVICLTVSYLAVGSAYAVDELAPVLKVKSVSTTPVAESVPAQAVAPTKAPKPVLPQAIVPTTTPEPATSQSLVPTQVQANAPANTQVQTTDIQLGKHYRKLSERIRANTDVKRFAEADNNKTKVVMFFSYACYWCSQLNKPFDNWALQHMRSVKTHMFPVAFNKAWLVLAKGYFTAQALDSTGVVDDGIFAGIHAHGLPLWEEKQLEDFFGSKGISKDKFKSTFNSFDVDTKVKLADELSLAFEIDATPNIIVIGAKGAYITNLVMTRDKNLLFATVDYLVKKVEK